MKAIVMAGGEGTRLRPVTSGRPKPMVELLGRPVLAHTVELLKKYDITDICFTLRYLPKVIEDYFGDGSEFGVKITCRVEDTPLGTAGGVKACGDFIGDDDFLVISGDAVCDFDLKKCIDFHNSQNAEATLVLYEHPEPTEYGVVVTDDNGKIRRFVEKPPWDMVTTNLINTGIYLLSPRVLEDVPENEAYDFGRDLFPKLLKEERALYGFCSEGYWCDIGSPEAYRHCCADIVAGKTGIHINAPQLKPGVWSSAAVPEGVIVAPPVFIGEGCTLASGAKIGPNCVISDGSAVMEGAEIVDSVINGAVVNECAKIEKTIVGRGAVIGKHADIGAGGVIGDGAVIGDGSVVFPEVKVWTTRRIPRGSVVKHSITGDSPENGVHFSSYGTVSGEFPAEITPETVMAFGGVLGNTGRTGAAFTGGETARLLAAALGCGVTGAGGEFFELDCRFEAELSCSCRTFALNSAVFIRQQGLDVTLSFFGGDGMPLETSFQRKLEAAGGGEYPRVNGLTVGSVSTITGTSRAYMTEAVEFISKLGSRAGGITVSVQGGGAENRALKAVLESLGHRVTAGHSGVPVFFVSSGGLSLSASCEDGRTLSVGQMLAVTADAAFRCGIKEIAIPYGAPTVIGKLEKRYGGRVLLIPRDGERARQLYLKQIFMRDGIFAAALVTAAMAADGVSLSQLYSQIPQFALASRRVDVACSRAKAMRILAGSCGEMASELTCGLSIDTGGGRANISPCRDGSALMIRSEGTTEEIAEELCSNFARLAGDLRDK